MRRLSIWISTVAMGAGLFLMLPDEAQAQRRGGGYPGGGGGYRGGGYSGGGYRGGSGNNNWLNYVPGFNNYGYGNRYYGNNYYRDGYYGGYDRGFYSTPGYSGTTNYSYYPPTESYSYPAQTYSAAPAYSTVDPGRTAMIEIHVADPNATVQIDGQTMASSGMVRTFTTPPIEPGYNYQHQVRMQSPNGGMQERTVTFQAGQRVTVDFTRSASTATPASTSDAGSSNPAPGANTLPMPNRSAPQQQPVPQQQSAPQQQQPAPQQQSSPQQQPAPQQNLPRPSAPQQPSPEPAPAP